MPLTLAVNCLFSRIFVSQQSKAAASHLRKLARISVADMWRELSNSGRIGVFARFFREKWAFGLSEWHS